MEVEFLSNMRYSLFVSEEQWRKWHVILARFWEYFERASSCLSTITRGHSPEHRQRSSAPPTPIPTTPIPTPTPTPTLNPIPNLPTSTPTPPMSTRHSSPYASTSYGSEMRPRLPTSLSTPMQLAPPVVSPLVRVPEMDLGSRKRSRDDDHGYDHGYGHVYGHGQHPALESQPPPPKRSARATPLPSTTTLSAHVPRLPTPNLVRPAMRPNLDFGTLVPSARLPHPGNCSASSVYSTQPPAVRPQVTVAPSVAPSMSSGMSSGMSSSGVGHLQPIRHPLMTSAPNHLPLATTATPTTYSLTPTSSTLSPSYILTDRGSPYRPVREVSTLLVPPQSVLTPMAPPALPQSQMHYQPLAKARSEYRTGVVPYSNHDTWPGPQPYLPWTAPPRTSGSR